MSVCVYLDCICVHVGKDGDVLGEACQRLEMCSRLWRCVFVFACI